MKPKEYIMDEGRRKQRIMELQEKKGKDWGEFIELAMLKGEMSYESYCNTISNLRINERLRYESDKLEKERMWGINS